jgi:hypothetical protein
MKTIPSPLRCLAFLLLMPLAGCQSARMAVPADLEARADAYPCSGRGGFSLSEKFSFGPYEVFQVKRGWTRRTTWTLALYENAKARQQYEFSLQTPSGRIWQGQAATGVRRENLKSSIAGGELTWGLEKNMEYLARLGLPDQPTAWTLTLAEKTADDVPRGVLTDGTRTYQIAGSRNLAGSSIPLMETAGFLLRDGNRLVAAVDLINAGSVFLDRHLPAETRDPLAAAAAALLLYRDIAR